MRLAASDIISLYRPTPCPLRVYLREKGVLEVEPSAFEEILKTLGRRHAQGHLTTLGTYEDLSVVPADERFGLNGSVVMPVIVGTDSPSSQTTKRFSCRQAT